MSDESQTVSKVEADRQAIIEAQQQGRAATVLVYLRLSGPGWLQSAMTLGGGSLASSLYLGVLAGFSMLWLQPLAMVLGIIMLSAIGYFTMSTGMRPFAAINEHVNPVLGWGWALASLVANMVWCMPQFSLATGVLQQNLLPGVLGPEGSLTDFNAKLLIAGGILAITIPITWAYDSGSWGIKLYERLLKAMVAAIVICFFGVVITLGMNEGLDWSAIRSGFIPDINQLYQPAAAFLPLLEDIGRVSGEATRTYWNNVIVAEQRGVMISAAATAVGINMTFLFPYSILARGWRREFRGLAIFDLATGMLIPFMLATSCVTIAAATQFHAVAPTGFLGEVDASGEAIAPPARLVGHFDSFINDRLRNEFGPSMDAWDEATLLAHRAAVSPEERRLAAMLVKRDAGDLSQALEPLTGSFVANLIFGFGVLGMTLSTITLLMLISGFVICEMCGLPAKGWPHRLGCLAAGVGALGPFVWGQAAFALAVPTSVFGMTLLPIAYFTFFFLMNQGQLLGDDMPRGGRRILWNTLMAIAAGVALAASSWSIWNFVTTEWARGGGHAVVAGLAATVVVVFLGLAVVVQFARRNRVPSS